MTDDTSKDGTNADDIRAAEGERVFLCVVDESEEFDLALRYACNRAINTGGRIALAYIVAPAEFQHWVGIGNLMEQEGREQAEAIVRVVGDIVLERTGKMPVVYIRYGKPQEELAKLIDEENRIAVLVLGASISGNGPGPIVAHIINEMSGGFHVPITIVPGSMSEAEIDAIA